MHTHKGVMIILDGLGDRPVPALDGLTPLESAHTPTLDRLAGKGLCGLMSPMAPGIPVGTQIGAGLLMGLAPADLDKLARGPVQAAGAGLTLQNGDIALRCNLATLEPNGQGWTILDRRAGRISEGTDRLVDALDGLILEEDITVHLKASTQHRAALLLSGPRLSDAITDTDPGDGYTGQGVLLSRARNPEDEHAMRTAQAVNALVRKSYKILKAHPVNTRRVKDGHLPANGLLTRGAGKMNPLRNWIRHLGLKAAVITGEGTTVGLGRLFGFEVIRQPAFTATRTTDVEAKVAATLAALEHNDLAFLHVKGADTCAHDLDPLAKKTFLETIDSALAPLLSTDLVLAVTGDHTTNSVTGRHSGDAVPCLLSAPYGRRDAVASFGETACMQGGLGHVSAPSFLSCFLDLMNQLHNYRTEEQVFLPPSFT